MLRRRALFVPEPLRAAPVRDGTDGSPSGRKRSWRSHTHPGPDGRSSSLLSYCITGSSATPDVKTPTRSGATTTLSWARPWASDSTASPPSTCAARRRSARPRAPCGPVIRSRSAASDGTAPTQGVVPPGGGEVERPLDLSGRTRAVRLPVDDHLELRPPADSLQRLQAPYRPGPREIGRT